MHEISDLRGTFLASMAQEGLEERSHIYRYDHYEHNIIGVLLRGHFYRWYPWEQTDADDDFVLYSTRTQLRAEDWVA